MWKTVKTLGATYRAFINTHDYDGNPYDGTISSIYRYEPDGQRITQFIGYLWGNSEGFAYHNSSEPRILTLDSAVTGLVFSYGS